MHISRRSAKDHAAGLRHPQSPRHPNGRQSERSFCETGSLARNSAKSTPQSAPSRTASFNARTMARCTWPGPADIRQSHPIKRTSRIPLTPQPRGLSFARHKQPWSTDALTSARAKQQPSLRFALRNARAPPEGGKPSRITYNNINALAAARCTGLHKRLHNYATEPLVLPLREIHPMFVI